MDPELARIRRERYLAHKKGEGAVGEGDVRPSAASTKQESSSTNGGGDIIVIDSSDEENDEDRKPSSKMAAAGLPNNRDDDEVECLPGPAPPKKKRAKCSAPSEGVCYLDEGAGTLHDTHPRVKDEGGWLWARNPRKERNSRNDVEGMTREFERIVARGNGVTSDEVLDLAVRHEVLYGKWMIYAKSAPALVWTKIRDAVFGDELGCTAKISTEPLVHGCFLICVYTADFTDKRDVLRVRHGLLRILEKGGSSLSFKPDCYTYLEINGGNVHKIQPTIYGCGGKSDPECSVLRVSREKCTKRPGCPRCFPRCKS